MSGWRPARAAWGLRDPGHECRVLFLHTLGSFSALWTRGFENPIVSGLRRKKKKWIPFNCLPHRKPGVSKVFIAGVGLCGNSWPLMNTGRSFPSLRLPDLRCGWEPRAAWVTRTHSCARHCREQMQLLTRPLLVFPCSVLLRSIS